MRVSNLGLSAVELLALRTWLRQAVDSPCIEDWEFDSLVGCSRRQARHWLDAWLLETQLDQRRLDQVVTMLSILAGSSQLEQTGRFSSGALDLLLEKLFWSTEEVRSTRADHQSSVSLRVDVHTNAREAPRKPAQKRRAAAQ
ncbi:MAG: hypothetical protein JWN04_6304 [Myxococcaceae bacterium]|nr:hypothetical protein [Myxococcaceae bacterium]